MNPRVSRSALASKATGFPIAKIAARLAVGYTLDEIDNDITREDAGVLRAHDRLRGRQVAALGVREVPRRRPRAHDAHEERRGGDGHRAHLQGGLPEGDALARARPPPGRRGRHADAAQGARSPGAERYEVVLEAFRLGASVDEIHERTGIDPLFLEELRALALDPGAALAGDARYKSVDTCAAEFQARTPYYYSAWSGEPGTRSSAASEERRHPRHRGPTASARASSSTTAACTPR